MKKKLLVVVGSVYADIVIPVDQTQPDEAHVFAGGKGVIQAACATQLACPTSLVGQVGKDVHAGVVKEDLTRMGVRLDHLNAVSAPTGQAVFMMQDGSFGVLVEGANVSWPRLSGGIARLQPGAQQMIRCAAALLLQREIPDAVNIEAAKIASSSNVPVILDCSGSEAPVPEELLKRVTVLYSTEEYLTRKLHSAALDDPVAAASLCMRETGVRQVLFKSDSRGLVLVSENGEVAHCTSGSTCDPRLLNDVLAAAYAVAFIDSHSPAHALKFAACAASLSARSPTGNITLPDTKSVLQLIQEIL